MSEATPEYKEAVARLKAEYEDGLVAELAEARAEIARLRTELEEVRGLLRAARELCGMATGDPEDTATRIDDYLSALDTQAREGHGSAD